MSDVGFDIFNACISRVRTKRGGRGWTTFNAVCCMYNGETPDKRTRGGLLRTDEGGLVYHCFNCGFVTGWTPGSTLGKRLINLLEWFGLSSEEIRRLNFEAFKIRGERKAQPEAWLHPQFEFAERALPAGAKPFTYWLEQDLIDPDFLMSSFVRDHLTLSLYEVWQH
jgi:hypothetical protein